MNVWGIPQQAKHKPQIRICLDQGDTTVVINDQIMRDGYHETTLKSVVTKRTKRVYGFIYLNNRDIIIKSTPIVFLSCVTITNL